MALKTLNETWQEIENEKFKGAPDEVIRTVKTAFFLGADTVFSFMFAVDEETNGTGEEVNKMYDKFYNEVQAYFKALEKPRKKQRRKSA